MSYRIRGLSPAPFAHYFGQSEKELARLGARRVTVDACPGFPDRVTLTDLPVGTTAILLHYEHQPAQSPYRASHAIYIREGGDAPFDAVGKMPEVLLRRPISLRGFDGGGMMVAAELAEGAAVEGAIEAMLGNEAVAYIHAHYAGPGCFAARIERA